MSPTTSFAGPPISTRVVENGLAIRKTYFAVQDDGLQIRYVASRETDSSERASEASTGLPASAGSVIHLDILNTREDQTVVVIQEDGTITIATSELRDTWSTTLPTEPEATQRKIIAASAMSMDSAANSLLKYRNDLLKSLPEHSFLVQLFENGNLRSGQQPGYSLWSLPIRFSTSTSSQTPQKLFEHTFSAGEFSPVKSLSSSRVSFGPQGTTLEVKTSQSYSKYRLNGSAPARTSTYQKEKSIGGFDALSLSTSSLLVALPGSLQLVDAKYEIVRATHDHKKRKNPGTDAVVDSVAFVAYFAQIRRVVCQRGSSLIAFDLRAMAGKQLRTPGSNRLAASIGHGVRNRKTAAAAQSLNLGFAVAGSDEGETWTALKSRLDQVNEEGDDDEFEQTLLDKLRVNESHAKLRESIVDYTLNQVFRVGETSEAGEHASEASLKVNFARSKLIKHLSSTGCLSARRLTRALQSADLGPTLASLPSDALPRALYEADEASKLLGIYVKHNTNTDLVEQLSTARFLLEVAKLKSEAGLQRVDGMPQASTTLVSASSTLPDLEQTAFESHVLPQAFLHTIITSLNKLSAFESHLLSTTLQSSWSTPELITLIQFLRQQLFQGGHASWLVWDSQTSDNKALTGTEHNQISKGPSSHPLRLDAIVKLLSACLDTLGPLHLLGAGNEDEAIQSIIPDLLSEVELSTQYIEESVELQGIVRETLRYVQSRESNIDRTKSKDNYKHGRHEMGEFTTLYSQDVDDETNNGLAGMLPLSLKDEDVIDPIKMRKGGGQIKQRSARETLMLEARQKGPYTFERLII